MAEVKGWKDWLLWPLRSRFGTRSEGLPAAEQARPPPRRTRSRRAGAPEYTEDDYKRLGRSKPQIGSVAPRSGHAKSLVATISTMSAKFWDKRTQKYDDDIAKHGGVYMRTVERTKSLLSISDVVLDLGCASGEFSLDIAPCVQSVRGIDTSTNMIAMATQKASDRSVDNVAFDPNDIFDRSLDAHSYTGVLAFNFLHLVEEDIHAVLNRVNQLLPTGGLLISQTPCLGERGLLFRVFVDFAQKVKIAPPILSLTVPELEAQIAGADFDIVESNEWDPKNAIHWIVARKRQGAS